MKKIVFAFLVASLSSNLFAQILPKEAEGKEFTILVAASVKKGEGCIQTTTRAKYPLTKEECAVLLEKHGMFTRVDAKNLMIPISKEAIIPEGAVFLYVVTSAGKGWTLPDPH